jgi:SAM-dependent MidA family methyltransferase
MCAETTQGILPEPPTELKHLSNELVALVRERIADEGPISFSEYMEMALYSPGLGYYSAGLQKFGAGGDFVTSPQLGNVFAGCIAAQIVQVSAELGEYDIIEAGAGSGILAADILTILENTQPPARYLILERSAHLRQVQKETLQKYVPQWLDRVVWLDQPPEENWQGVFLANEVLDALTVERFCLRGDDILQLQVTSGKQGLQWHEGICPMELENQVTNLLGKLERPLSEGYRSEINTSLPAWLQVVTASMQRGVALFIDYGYVRQEYYQPQRFDGTLICHYQQRAHDDPFSWPGLTDLSASVDFTALAEAADECELDVSGYTNQAMFLLGCGLEQVFADSRSLSPTDQIARNNEIRKLTLPGEMGERFQVMALSRGLDEELTETLRGFSLADWRYRL